MLSSLAQVSSGYNARPTIRRDDPPLASTNEVSRINKVSSVKGLSY